jgi:hypothetical protein
MMSSIRTAVAILSCCAACTSYQVRQSALVPPPVLPSQPAPGLIADAYVGDDTVTFLSRPERAAGDDSALWVSRHVLQGAGTLHFGWFGLRMTGMAGLGSGAMAAAPTSLRRPDDTTGSFGIGAVAAIPIDQHVLTATLDGRILWIPSYYEARCSAGCEGIATLRTGQDREVLIQPSLSLGYGYRVTPIVRVFGAFAFQDHPTNDAVIDSAIPSPDVRLGPMYVTAGAGVELTIVPWLSLIPLLQWPLTRSPIEYGPFLGLGVRGGLPDDAQHD